MARTTTTHAAEVDLDDQRIKPRRSSSTYLRRAVRQEVSRQAEQGRRVRLMFQDEGRFGLLGTPRRCWAPRRIRPVVGARLERKCLYAFGAVSPHDGVLDSLVLPWVNAETMSMFLAEVAKALRALEANLDRTQ